MKKFQMIVVIAFAALVIPAVVCAVFFGNGAVTVAAPPGRPLKVSVDGKEVASLEPGEHHRLNVEQGSHELLLESAGKTETHTLDVTNGTFDQFYPLSDQCFVLFDVTNFIFEKEKLTHEILPEITVKDRFPGKPFTTPAIAKFSLAELPTDGERRPSEVLLQLPCADLARDDAALIARAAFAKPN
jgi:hypothetical protein